MKTQAILRSLRLFAMGSSIAWFSAAPGALAADSEAYEWSQVPIGGGGNITSLVIHPKVKDVMYLGADVGGVDRWDAESQRWIPTLNYYNAPQGVEGLAVDPSDATGNIVYAAVGSHDGKLNGTVLKSVDRGEHWTASATLFPNCSNSAQPWKHGLAVDPANGQVLYFAARNGLWRSTDGGVNWTKLPGAPEGDQANLGKGTGVSGNVMVILDPSSGTAENPKRTRRAYVSPYGFPLYKTEDGGETWSEMPGAPKNVTAADIDPDGVLYCASRLGGLSKYTGGAAGAWSDISPKELDASGAGYAAIQVDPFNKQHILALQNYKPCYSLDGGATWAYIATHGKNQTVKATPDWYSKANQSKFGWGGKHLRFDPHREGVVWESDAFLTWKTENIYAPVVHWENFTVGHEETVGTAALISPPSGPTLLYSGAADVCGFRHTSITDWPEQIIIKPRSTALQLDGADFQESDPNFAAFVGTTGWNGPGGGGYTTDGGETFAVFPNPETYPSNQGGRIAISADSRNMVWATGYPEQKVYFSHDAGSTWKLSGGLPAETPVHLGWSIFYFMSPLSSDRVNGRIFYFYHQKAGEFYRSTDSGATFGKVAEGLPKNIHAKIVADFTREGELWLCFKDIALFHSTDGGATWARIGSMQLPGAIAIGKGPDANTPSIYAVGKLAKNDESHIYRSDDRGSTWTQIDIHRPYPNNWVYMTGDRRVHGRVFIESSTGIYVGQKASAP